MTASKGSALLRLWREKNGVSQAGLAEQLRALDPHVRASQASVSGWESGACDPPARALVLFETITDGAVVGSEWFAAADSTPPEAA